MASPNAPLEALRVDLAALRRRGIDQHPVEARLSPPWLRAALRDTDAEVETEGAVSLRVLLQPEGVVVVQGRLQVSFTVPCGRCLAPAAVDGATEICATFMRSAAALAADHAALDPDEEDPEESADVWTYDGPVLSLAEMVTEQVALAYPMRVLCERGDACRGLCSNCGHELNAVAPEIRQCPSCANEVPLTPVADPPSADAEGPERDERKGESPLAAALRGIQLD